MALYRVGAEPSAKLATRCACVMPALARTGRAFVHAPDSTVECVDRLRTPGSGTVSVLGLDPAGDRGEPRLCLGAQPQDSQLPERLRVGETLKLYS